MNKGKILLKFFPFEMEKWKVNARNWGQSTDTNILDTSAFNSSGVSPSVVSPRDDTPRWDIGRKTTNMRQIEGSEAGGDTSHWQISDMSKQSTPSHLTSVSLIVRTEQLSLTRNTSTVRTGGNIHPSSQETLTLWLWHFSYERTILRKLGWSF